MTGQYQHKAGVGYFDVNLGLPAYQGYLNKESLTLGEVFRSGGYSTLMSGKWHVGSEDKAQWPNQRGFDQFYGILKGAANYFNTDGLPFGKTPYPVALIRNNEELHPKADSYYFTDEIENNAVQFLDEQNRCCRIQQNKTRKRIDSGGSRKEINIKNYNLKIVSTLDLVG